jgi:hypothetical protein
MAMEYKTVMVQATLNYAWLTQEDPTYGGYKVVLTNLSPEAVAALSKAGVEAGRSEEGAFEIKAKSKQPIKVALSDNTEYTGSVGNGTTAAVKLMITKFEKAKSVVIEREGKDDEIRKITHGVYVDKIKIIDLVEFNEGEGKDDFDSAL